MGEPRWLANEWELNETNLDWARAEVLGWLELKGPRAAFSPAFVDQIAHHFLRASERLGSRRLNFHVHAVFDAIGAVEGTHNQSITPPHKQFGLDSAPFLKGLWHKHFFDAQFLLHNLAKEWKNRKRGDTLWHRDLKRLMTKAGLGSDAALDEIASLIARVATIDAFETRAGSRSRNRVVSRLTGQWIIFSRVGNQNVYLTLATHEEAETSPESLRLRLRETISSLRDELATAVREQHTAFRAAEEPP